MTEQEELILLQDLCARLPYDVKVIDDLGRIYTLTLGNSYLIDLYYGNGDYVEIPIKPYLRPMSSMTEKEIEMYFKFRIPDTINVVNPHHCCGDSICAVVDGVYMRYLYDDMVSLNTIDYLNSIHMDYRGLIPMELALTAPEGMYNTKNE